jgi:hypothetical protein
MLDDRYAAAEATICLSHFQGDIPAAEHDQMLRHIVEFQRLDVGKRPGRIEAGYPRNGRVCSDDGYLLSWRNPRVSSTCLWRKVTPSVHPTSANNCRPSQSIGVLQQPR